MRDAFIRLVDRTKDLVKSGGEWISSVELENAIMAHPDVVEAAVIAVPDERWGERPCACVVRRAGSDLDADGLRAHLGERVAKWWIPERVEFIDEVPKTSVGKFDKKLLRAQFARQRGGGRLRVALTTSADCALIRPCPRSADSGLWRSRRRPFRWRRRSWLLLFPLRGPAGSGDVSRNSYCGGHQGRRQDQADRSEQRAAADRHDQDGERMNPESGAVCDRLHQLLEHAVGEQNDDGQR